METEATTSWWTRTDAQRHRDVFSALVVQELQAEPMVRSNIITLVLSVVLRLFQLPTVELDQQQPRLLLMPWHLLSLDKVVRFFSLMEPVSLGNLKAAQLQQSLLMAALLV